LNLCRATFFLIICLLIIGGSALRAQNNNSTDTAPGVNPNAAPAPAPAAAPAPETTASNLVTNGNFEMADPNDPTWATNWGKAKGITWETENGKHFLRLVQQTPGKMLMAYREVPIPAGVKGLEYFVRYRTAGIVLGTSNWFDARTILHFMDSTRKQVGPDPGALIFSNQASDWTDLHERFLVPQGAVTLQLLPSLFQVNAGTLDLAEIRVTPLSDADAATLK
jgi:hypothetical protein